MAKKWTMPKWMEPYRPIIMNTGGNPIEELMNDDGTNSNVVVNAPRALICVAVKSQVALLEKLHANDALLIPQIEAVINSIAFVAESRALPEKMRKGVIAIGETLQKAIERTK